MPLSITVERGFCSRSALEEAIRLLEERIASGRFGSLVRDLIEGVYGSGFPEGHLLGLARAGADALQDFLSFLRAAGVDYGPHILTCFSSGKIGPLAVERFELHLTTTEHNGSILRGTFRVSRQLDAGARGGALDLHLAVDLFLREDEEAMFIFPPERHVIPWDQTSPTGEQTGAEVTLAVALDMASDQKVAFGRVTLLPIG